MFKILHDYECMASGILSFPLCRWIGSENSLAIGKDASLCWRDKSDNLQLHYLKAYKIYTN